MGLDDIRRTARKISTAIADTATLPVFYSRRARDRENMQFRRARMYQYLLELETNDSYIDKMVGDFCAHNMVEASKSALYTLRIFGFQAIENVREHFLRQGDSGEFRAQTIDTMYQLAMYRIHDELQRLYNDFIDEARLGDELWAQLPEPVEKEAREQFAQYSKTMMQEKSTKFDNYVDELCQYAMSNHALEIFRRAMRNEEDEWKTESRAHIRYLCASFLNSGF